MRARTHIAFAAALISFWTVSVPALLASFFAIVADWDFWFKNVQHRTWSHSLFIAVPLLIVGALLHDVVFFAALAYLSHPILDLLNRSPVYLLYPIKTPFRMFRRLSVRVGSVGEEAVFWICVAVLVGSLFWAQRGTYHVREFESGLFLGGGMPVRIKSLQQAYEQKMRSRDSAYFAITPIDSRIEVAREDSVTFSQWPKSPAKVAAAQKEMEKLREEREQLRQYVDTLTIDSIYSGVYLPFSL